MLRSGLRIAADVRQTRAAARAPGRRSGKRLSGRTRFANRTLRHALVESACGGCGPATGNSRPGIGGWSNAAAKKAIVAVAHSLLVIAYHVLRGNRSYRKLGGNYFDRLNADRLTRYRTKRLAALGYVVA